MTTPAEMTETAVRTALVDGAASSPIYDTDTLVANIMTAIDGASVDLSQRAAPEAADNEKAALEARIAELEAERGTQGSAPSWWSR